VGGFRGQFRIRGFKVEGLGGLVNMGWGLGLKWVDTEKVFQVNLCLHTRGFEVERLGGRVYSLGFRVEGVEF